MTKFQSPLTTLEVNFSLQHVEKHIEHPVQPERTRGRRRTREEVKQLIIVALRQDHLSMREIASQLGYTKLTDTIRSIVREMIVSGEAEFLYPDKTNNPNQKIRLK